MKTWQNYVSTACRSGDHKDCEHLVLLCTCQCHEGQWSRQVERRKNSHGTSGSGAGSPPEGDEAA